MTNTTKTLEGLGDEAREKFNVFIKDWTEHNYPHLIDSDDNDGEFFRNYLDLFAEKVWNAALDACRDKVEEMCPDYYDTTPSSEDLAANHSLREALSAIDSLRTGNGKETV